MIFRLREPYLNVNGKEGGTVKARLKPGIRVLTAMSLRVLCGAFFLFFNPVFAAGRSKKVSKKNPDLERYLEKLKMQQEEEARKKAEEEARRKAEEDEMDWEMPSFVGPTEEVPEYETPPETRNTKRSGFRSLLWSGD